jgi:hypothetical protein
MMMRLALVLPLLALLPALDGCGLGGCVQANGDSCGGPYDAPSPDMARGPTCASSCGFCGGAGQGCIVPAPITQDHAFCAHTCVDDRDCASNERCLALFAAMAPSACVADTMAIGCGDWSNEICDTQPACDGENVALEPFSDAARGLCGWERVSCANGCAAGTCM